jgi:hypothetical protein
MTRDTDHTMAAERRNSPRLVEVTVEWHSDGRRLSAPLAKLGAGARRALALAAAALIVGAGALVIAESPSDRSRGTPTVQVPHGVKLRCGHSSTPRVFVNVPARYAARAAHALNCP